MKYLPYFFLGGGANYHIKDIEKKKHIDIWLYFRISFSPLLSRQKSYGNEEKVLKIRKGGRKRLPLYPYFSIWILFWIFHLGPRLRYDLIKWVRQVSYGSSLQHSWIIFFFRFASHSLSAIPLLYIYIYYIYMYIYMFTLYI